MKELVYTAVLYKDDERGTNTGWYTIAIKDLNIVTEGKTVVDAYIRAKMDLCAMVDCAIKYNCEIPAPTDFEKFYNDKKNKNNIVLLIDALA